MHGGGHAWQGGMHGWGVCMAGDHAWQGGMCGWGTGMHGRGACVAGGCMAGGMRDGGACMPQQILWNTVNERAVRILLECILVNKNAFQ